MEQEVEVGCVAGCDPTMRRVYDYGVPFGPLRTSDVEACARVTREANEGIIVAGWTATCRNAF